ncbi:MAG: hypothetical protein K0R27_740 [Xanthobacteraceae bacterium]|jgi:hypothetical protein|nr:hypothetical protein [Xanthobacteraceae bacterium]
MTIAEVPSRDVVEIIVQPKGNGRYAALVEGEVIVTSRQPFYASARALLKRGVYPETPITMRHEGSSIASMRSTVGHASQWRVEESDAGGLRIRRYIDPGHGPLHPAWVAQDCQQRVSILDLPDRYERPSAALPAHP